MIKTGQALALMLIVAACGTTPYADQASETSVDPDTTATSPTTSTPPSGVTTDGALDVIVPPDEAGRYPADMAVSCGNESFPIGALEGIDPLDQADPGGVAEAVAAFLDGDEGAFWPQEGWQVLNETPDEVLLVAEAADGRVAFMTVSNDGSGWMWSGGSIEGDPCRLEFTVPEGLNTVDWRPDPEAPALSSENTQVTVILQERECVSGQSIGDRLLGPQIVMTDSEVFIAFAAEPPPGDAFDCQGNPETSYVVELPEAIGDRELVEGLEIGIDLADYVD